jgi:glycosyltransferase involved in cell wall biosynthesis
LKKKTQPLVSIIINCYNSEAYLREAIDSVYSQSYTNWEIILWDNASTDHTAEIAQSYDSKLRYFRGEETVVLGSARNLAIREVRGEFLAILDSDDVWLPDKLEKQVPHFENEKVGLSYSNTIYFNNDGKSFTLYKKMMPKGKIFQNLLQFYFLCISSVVIRKSALESLHEYFDSRFGMIEEMDLFCRIAHDWECSYTPEVVTKYRVHSSSDTWKKFEKIAVEYKLLLDKFISIYPDFVHNYTQEVTYIKKMTTYFYAVNCLLSGDSAGARKHIKLDCMNKRLLLLYIFSFMPARLFKFLYGRRKMLH